MCADPNCPANNGWKEDPSMRNPNCMCNKALAISLPPGEHLHCPVHPERIVAIGSYITC